MDNLVARLKLMNKTNGYTTNYTTVDQWRRTPVDPQELPAVFVEDPECDVVEYHNEFTDYQLTINIWIGLDGTEAPATIRNMIQDVYKCLGADVSCGGYVHHLKPDSDSILIDQKDDHYGCIFMSFLAGFTTVSWDTNTSI